MSQVQEKYQEAESNYGSDLLNLVVAEGLNRYRNPRHF